MVNNKLPTQHMCDSELHGEHLCYILAQGLHLADPPAYSALLDPPRFRCAHCRRTANSGDSLCLPARL